MSCRLQPPNLVFPAIVPPSGWPFLRVFGRVVYRPPFSVIVRLQLATSTRMLNCLSLRCPLDVHSLKSECGSRNPVIYLTTIASDVTLDVTALSTAFGLHYIINKWHQKQERTRDCRIKNPSTVLKIFSLESAIHLRSTFNSFLSYCMKHKP